MENRSYHTAACPICRSRGNDTRGDNLCVYKDGHSYCYACGYFIPTSETIASVKSKLSKPLLKLNESKCADLPDDITGNLALASKVWLMKYNIKHEEMSNFWWSPSQNQLIFPVFNDEGLLIFWQARNFGPTPRNKYFSSGSFYEELLLLGDTGDSSHVILVEDVVSSIILARDYLSIPLFGSIVSRDNLIYLWLDADKREEAILIANRAKELGINMGVITSAFDPKCYMYKEINNFVTRRLEN